MAGTRVKFARHPRRFGEALLHWPPKQLLLLFAAATLVGWVLLRKRPTVEVTQVQPPKAAGKRQEFQRAAVTVGSKQDHAARERATQGGQEQAAARAADQLPNPAAEKRRGGDGMQLTLGLSGSQAAQPAPTAEEHSTGSALPKSASQLSVLLALIGRDVATELPYVLRNIQRLGDKFAEAHVILVENDSQDGTREVFQGWADEYTRSAQTPGTRSAKLVSFTHGSNHKDLSTLGMARNKYLDALSEPEYAGVDYLIAVDTDMCFSWDVERQVGIINALLPFSGTEWDVLYANGVCGWYWQNGTETPPFWPDSAGVYCDLFALVDSRGELHSMPDGPLWMIPYTCDFSRLDPKGWPAAPECRMLGGQAVVPVQAGFGGWGMFRADLFREGAAGGARGCRHDEQWECEHVSLGRCLQKAQKKLLVATGLVVDWEGCDEQQQNRWDDWRPP